MPFISSSEAKNAYFMSGEATNEIYIFSLHEMKLYIYMCESVVSSITIKNSVIFDKNTSF